MNDIHNNGLVRLLMVQDKRVLLLLLLLVLVMRSRGDQHIDGHQFVGGRGAGGRIRGGIVDNWNVVGMV